MANALGEKVAQYMRDYYRAHSTHPPMIPGATRTEKVCPGCGELKPRSAFTIRQSGRVGHLSTYCKRCQVKRDRAWKDRDPTVYRRVEWPSKLKKYGLTVADYERILAEQGGACGLCGATDPNVGSRQYKKRKRTAFDVDHCHTTGRVRGLLCTRCNRLVGLANDDLKTARRLVEYLMRFEREEMQ